MALRKILALFVLCAALMSKLACVDAPVEISLDKPIEIKESSFTGQMNDLQAEILRRIDLGTATTPEACTTAFSTWIKEQFDLGLVPKRPVTALEYGKKSVDPKIGHCYTVNLAVELPAAWQNLVNENKVKLEAEFFNLGKVREDIEKRECIKEFINPDKNKIKLTGMKSVILKNTLNYDAPSYRIYYTTKELGQEAIQVPGAEKELVKNGSLKFFGTTQSFAPGFNGSLEVNLVDDPEKQKAAKDAFNSLRSDLVAYPQVADMKPQIRMINDQPYFVILKGDAKINVEMDVLINATLNDARCMIKKRNKI